MKHLKNIKERSSTKDSEFDLRGLGDTSAVRAEYPLTHLTIKTENLDLIKEVSSIFSLEYRKSERHKSVFHLFSPRHDLNHKEKSVILFGASMFVSHRDSGAKMLMNEISQLAKLIKNEKINGSEDQDDTVVEWIKSPKHLTVHPGMQLYLLQAGFDIQPTAGFQDFKREGLNALRAWVTNPKNPKQVVGE
ncbi:MAG: hypothetical protein A4S09_12940 [Proteobacteria bacterium SG_bin7]|nr:MAG: hypothetical protein A4S09_12940 [Proteobacteria bacterium SG_bin7]